MMLQKELCIGKTNGRTRPHSIVLKAATVKFNTESEQRDLEQPVVFGSSAGLLTWLSLQIAGR